MDSSIKKHMEKISRQIAEAQQAQAEALGKIAPEYVDSVNKAMQARSRLPAETEKILSHYAKLSERAAQVGRADVRFSRSGMRSDSADSNNGSKSKEKRFRVRTKPAEPKGNEKEKNPETDSEALAQWTVDAKVLELLGDIHAVMEKQIASSDDNHKETMANEKTIRRQGWAILLISAASIGFGAWETFGEDHVIASMDKLTAELIELNDRFFEASAVKSADPDYSKSEQSDADKPSKSEAQPQPEPTAVHAPADSAESSSDQREP